MSAAFSASSARTFFSVPPWLTLSSTISTRAPGGTGRVRVLNRAVSPPPSRNASSDRTARLRCRAICVAGMIPLRGT